MSRRPLLKLRAFNPVKYLGSEADSIPAPYTAAELAVMTAGSSGLYLAILAPRFDQTRALALDESRRNRARFHKAPSRSPRRSSDAV